MRHIGELPNETRARQLSDYLLALDIKSKIEPEDHQWALWVFEEDQVGQAREEFARFQESPDDPRYAEARQAAENRRRAEERQIREYQRNTVDVRRQWERPLFARTPVTALLMAASILTAALTSNFDNPFKLCDRTDRVVELTIAKYRVRGDQIEYLPRLQEVREGQIYRLVTPIFLHFDILHLLFNMLWLRMLGSQIEQRRGSWRILGMVLVIAVTSNLAQYYWSGPGFGGMSGVDFGLFAYVWMKGRYEPGSGFYMPPQLAFLMMAWLIFCYVGPLNIANAAHTVGLLAGAAIGLSGVFLKRLRR